MVGSTGTVQNDDFENKNGGLKEKIVEGHQFAKNRKIFLASANEKNQFIRSSLVQTFNDKTKGIPTAVEGQVLQNFLDENGRLPRWNVAF
jgi:hypothetical protein